MHEFRRDNIKEIAPEERDLFEYDPKQVKRYDALKFEHIFRYETTLKATKWAIAVGGMFAFHRYFRTRDLQNAAHWFAYMSCFSFANIWISYQLQEFVVEFGSRKSMSLSARK